ncbi:MAG: Ppx/GppA family phosphatase [Rhizobiales bacterium]|nr:Ppx/GppA family phosphatase [Hyphomicrobiales bacterium]
MDDRPRTDGGLDPARNRWPRRRSRWGRRPARSQEGGPAATPGGTATYAALDLGTNNCRLLVARPTREGFRVVDAFSRIIRLGEGISVTQRISEAAIDRAIDALSVCRDKMQQRGVARARLIATEACRSAENGCEFVARISEAVGLDLEIIDRETEARLAATGCTPLVDPEARGVVLFDIGGGSSELVRMTSVPTDGGPPKPVIVAWTSLPVGVVTLAERFGGIDVGPALFERMIDDTLPLVRAFFNGAAGGRGENVHMLGTSGTVTTIAGVHLGLRRYDRRQVDGCWMTDREISGVVDRLLQMNYDERAANPCIGTERADLVLAGCAIMEAIRRTFPCTRLRVADRGLREGILVELMRADGVWADAARSA